MEKGGGEKNAKIKILFNQSREESDCPPSNECCGCTTLYDQGEWGSFWCVYIKEQSLQEHRIVTLIQI